MCHLQHPIGALYKTAAKPLLRPRAGGSKLPDQSLVHDVHPHFPTQQDHNRQHPPSSNSCPGYLVWKCAWFPSPMSLARLSAFVLCLRSVATTLARDSTTWEGRAFPPRHAGSRSASKEAMFSHCSRPAARAEHTTAMMSQTCNRSRSGHS